MKGKFSSNAIQPETVRLTTLMVSNNKTNNDTLSRIKRGLLVVKIAEYVGQHRGRKWHKALELLLRYVHRTKVQVPFV
jgi:hypothetical protein